MKKIVAIIGVSFLLAGGAMASEDLAKAKNCLTCHSADKKIVGPSYKDIVAKRGGEKGVEAALAAKIKGGSKGEWGQVPMPPNNVTDAEAATLAKWILTLK
ncbi:c-type cytochrome [Dechloromonas denitrificans]|jgi:cytochrome c|uniref:c-type cytochrome n=1 Tax=Azonexaceae TaxID=2008795 RepID=UPI001CF90B08|nr:c-type cytochrome [Dechloromonas denitrificans]UCV04684.1 c-type cytochrome [Dechloromonas denitrificans]UCV09053.1 c-type cytochrome [Dechloromonas denitrificans]